MSKPPRGASLKDIIAGNSEPATVEAVPLPAGAEVVRLETPAAEPARRARPAAGKGTLKERAVPMSLYLEPSVHEQLRELGFVERKKMHALVLEGLDLLFKKRGVSSIAQLTKAAK